MLDNRLKKLVLPLLGSLLVLALSACDAQSSTPTAVVPTVTVAAATPTTGPANPTATSTIGALNPTATSDVPEPVGTVGALPTPQGTVLPDAEPTTQQ